MVTAKKLGLKCIFDTCPSKLFVDEYFVNEFSLCFGRRMMRKPEFDQVLHKLQVKLHLKS